MTDSLLRVSKPHCTPVRVPRVPLLAPGSIALSSLTRATSPPTPKIIQEPEAAVCTGRLIVRFRRIRCRPGPFCTLLNCAPEELRERILVRASCLPEPSRRALVANAREDSPVSDALVAIPEKRDAYLSPSRFSIRSSLEAVEHFATRVRRFQSSFDRELSTVGEHRNPNSLYPLTTTHHLLPIPSHQTTKSPPTPSNLTTSRRLIRMILLRYYSLTVKTILAIIPYVSQPKFAGHLLLPLSSSQVCARRLSRPGQGDLSALCVKIRAL
jgi:hypothetical protein